MPRRRRSLPKSLSPDTLRALLKAADNLRDRLVVSIGYQVGLRVSEITKLEITDVDWQSGTVFIREGKGGKDRVCPVPVALLAQLRTMLGERQTGFLFPSPRGGKRLSSRAIQKLMRRLAVKAGLPDADKARKYHPHSLRHSFATRCLRAGADIIEVRDLMGHASVATTQQYLSSSPDRLKPAVERAAQG